VRGCIAVVSFDAFVAAGRAVAMALCGCPTAGAVYGYPYVSPVFVWTQMGDMVHRLRVSAAAWVPPPAVEGGAAAPSALPPMYDAAAERAAAEEADASKVCDDAYVTA